MAATFRKNLDYLSGYVAQCSYLFIVWRKRFESTARYVIRSGGKNRRHILIRFVIILLLVRIPTIHVFSSKIAR